MTIKFNNVYVSNTALVAGKVEKEGPMGKYFDKSYTDYYMDKKSIEKSEVILAQNAIDILMKKEKLSENDIDLLIGGDLTNQIAVSSYAASKYKIPFIGVYNACSITAEEIVLASSMIDAGKIKNAICFTSSHNLVAEKQFRNPIEYGAPKPKTSTTTSTGGASIMLTNKKTNIKVTNATVGKVIDLAQTDVNNMGAVMAPAAADTINSHLKNLGIDASYYDLILTGDLGIYGKEILLDYMKQKYSIDLSNNYNDCGVMLYDMKKQKDITAGGSGPVCSALVNYGYVYDRLKKGEINKVLLIVTGALFSPTFAFQKMNILGIAHAISLEAI